MATRYCVVYRTGGTENFRWQRSIAMARHAAVAKRQDVERMGYTAMVCDYDLSVSVGLPETYNGSTPLDTAHVDAADTYYSRQYGF